MDQRARITRVEQAACRDVVEACGPRRRAELGLSAQPCGPALVLRARAVPHPLHNRALGLAAGADEARPLVESVLGRFRTQDIERFLLQVPADASGDAVRACLGELGLRRYPRNWHELTRGRGAVPPLTADGVVIEEAGVERAREISAILARAFDVPPAGEQLYAAVVGRPRWRAYLGRIDGTTAGVGLLFVDGDTAYLAGGATVPAYRGRGIQGALMARRVATALELGCDLVVTNTGEAVPGEPNSSYNNMLRCGFARVSVTENWTLPDMPRFSHHRPSGPASTDGR